MFTPRFEWPASLRAFAKLPFVGPQLLKKKGSSSHDGCKAASPTCATPTDDSDIATFCPPASIDQSLIHPALRNLDAPISHGKEDTWSVADSAIDVSSCRSSLESFARLLRPDVKSSEESSKKAGTYSARESNSNCCSCKQEKVKQASEKPQRTEGTISLRAFERKMNIARVVARNKYTNTELREREFRWDDEFYVSSTGHLGVIQEDLNASHRQAIKTSPTGYRLRACSWHKIKTQFGKRGLKNMLGGLVPSIKLTDPEGTEWFLEDLKYYPEKEEGPKGDGYVYEYNSDEEVY